MSLQSARKGEKGLEILKPLMKYKELKEIKKEN